jgi:CBS domain-containing protein
MLMVAEMTGSLSILGPAMIAVGLAWFIVRRSDDTIYRSQLQSRADAPAQRLLIGMPLLRSVPVRQAMAQPRLVLGSGASVAQARHQLEEQGLTGAPVVDGEGRFEGTLSVDKLTMNGPEDDRRLGALVDTAAPTVSESAQLDVAVEAMAAANQHWVAVLDSERTVVGTIATSDVVRGYRLGLLASLRQMDPGNRDGGEQSSDRVHVAAGSTIADQRLRTVDLPLSVIVTSIQRDHDLVVPNGDTVLTPGDELVLIGNSSDFAAVRELAAAQVNGRSTPG